MPPSMTFLEEVVRTSRRHHERADLATSAMLVELAAVHGALSEHEDASDAFKALATHIDKALRAAAERVQDLEQAYETSITAQRELIERLQQIGGPR